MEANKCRNCLNWQKVSRLKKDNTEQGLCSFMENRIHLCFSNKEPDKDINNKSLVINLDAQLHTTINGITISSVDPTIILRHGWVWTDAGFYCSGYIKK